MHFSQGRSANAFKERLTGYERAAAARPWSPRTSIDWETPSTICDERRELACRLASAGSFTEEVGLLTCGKLLLEVDDAPTRFCLANQMADEAKHAEAFTRYVHAVMGGEPTPPTGPVHLLSELDSIKNPTALFIVHTLLEGFALDQFSYLESVFRGDPLGQLYRHVRRDEARHVAMGLDYIQFGLREDLSDEVVDAVKWCELNIFTIAQVGPEMFRDLADLSGETPSDIETRFLTRHHGRLDRILKPLQRSTSDEET